MIEGALDDLLRRCVAEEEQAWEDFTQWVKARGRMVLGVFEKLRGADREDVIASTLRNLMTAIRRGTIRGRGNAEIDSYVCRALRNQALNILRGHVRRRRAGESAGEGPDGREVDDMVADEQASQEMRMVVGEQLERIDKLLLTWPPEDRYLFTAKIHGVSAQVIQETLRRPPFKTYVALATIDTRFHRLRERMKRYIQEP